MNQTFFLQLQSTFIVILLLAGLYFRKNKIKHVKLMLFAMTWDFALVFQIIWHRPVFSKTLAYPELGAALKIHIILAILTLVGYGFILFLGRALMLGKLHLRKTHIRLGLSVLILRLCTFVTSFIIPSTH